MTAEEYFAAKGTNASLLKAFREDESLFQARQYMDVGLPDTKDLQFGRLFHASLEMKGGIPPEVVVLPFKDLRKQEARDYRDAMERLGKVVIHEKELEMLQGMTSALYDQVTPEVAEVFNAEDTLCEECLFVEHDAGCGPETFKVMLDVCNPSRHIIYDYKSVRDVRPQAISKAADKYGWFLQAYQYALVYSIAYKVDISEVDFRFIFSMKKAPYEISIRKVCGGAMDYGRDQWQRAYARFKEAQKTGEYPGYGHGLLDVPAWADTDVEGLIIDGEEVEL